MLGSKSLALTNSASYGLYVNKHRVVKVARSVKNRQEWPWNKVCDRMQDNRIVTTLVLNQL